MSPADVISTIVIAAVLGWTAFLVIARPHTRQDPADGGHRDTGRP